MPIYCFSNNEEIFNNSVDCDTIKIAAAEARGVFPGERVYIGLQREIDPSSFVDSEDILDLLSEQAYERVGEIADGWPDFSKDDHRELTERIQRTIDEFLKDTNNEPSFFAVEEVKSYPPLTDELMRNL